MKDLAFGYHPHEWNPVLKTALRSSLRSLTALQPQGNTQTLALAATALILRQTLDEPHVAALKARSHRSFPKHPSPVHVSQQSSSTDLAVPCTEEPQQTRCLLKYLLQLQVLVERSCVRRPLPRREKPSRPWVQTTSRLPQHPGKQSRGSPSHLQGEFFISCSTPMKCSPCFVLDHRGHSTAAAALPAITPQVSSVPREKRSQKRFSGFVLSFQ